VAYHNSPASPLGPAVTKKYGRLKELAFWGRKMDVRVGPFENDKKKQNHIS